MGPRMGGRYYGAKTLVNFWILSLSLPLSVCLSVSFSLSLTPSLPLSLSRSLSLFSHFLLIVFRQCFTHHTKCAGGGSCGAGNKCGQECERCWGCKLLTCNTRIVLSFRRICSPLTSATCFNSQGVCDENTRWVWDKRKVDAAFLRGGRRPIDSILGPFPHPGKLQLFCLCSFLKWQLLTTVHGKFTQTMDKIVLGRAVKVLVYASAISDHTRSSKKLRLSISRGTLTEKYVLSDSSLPLLRIWLHL